MSPSSMDNGYLIVTLWRDGRQRTRLVHRLVLTAFVGPPPEGQEALHANNDRADNRLENLSWGTHSENMLDQVEHGTHYRASRTRCAQGHPYDAENTYHYPGRKHRACRRCRAEYMRAWKAKKKAA